MSPFEAGTRALLVCPGRGSYGREQLGYLVGRSEAAQALVTRCDQWRERSGRPSVRTLDEASAFSATRHLAGEHASLLTFACSMADLVELHERFEVVGVTGNSMGWYTALAASGALSLDEAIRLVDTMGVYQEGNVVGGQVMWPLTGPDWQPDPARRQELEAALVEVRAAGHQAWWSIDLGSFAVLGGDEGGCRALLERLPSETRGARTFPTRLPKHAAFHTPLMGPTSERALVDLADLDLRRPAVPLIDGRGMLHTPWSADPVALFDYTLGEQVVAPYDFAAAVVSALHHTAPDVVVLLGPGNGLGGPVAATMVHDGWRGCATRSAFEATQAATPFLLSMGRPEQRELLTR